MAWSGVGAQGPGHDRAALPAAIAIATLALIISMAAAAAATPPPGTPPPAAAASTVPAATPVPVTPVVRIPFPQEDGSLTPYTFEIGYSLMTLVYDTVMWRDEKAVPQPWLAQTVDTSADGRKVTIRLRDGARWHDGPPVTSADVAFTLRYVAGHANPRFTPEVRLVDHVDAPDPTTAVISLKQPSPGFLDQTLADLPILPAHLWQALKPGKQAPDGPPIGSGPYRLTAHVPGQSYRFDANPGYFRGPPTVQTIMMPIISDAEATLKAFEGHNVDMIPASLPENDAARLNELGDRVIKGPDYLGGVLMLNVRRAPLDRPEVRKAVGQAIDPARVAQIVGNAVTANRGYVHPDSTWALPKDPHSLDEKAAARVLAPLKLPAIDILAPDNDGVKMEAAHQVVIALEQAGITAQVKPTPRAALSKAVGEDGSVPTFTMAIWNAYPLASYDPDFLSRAFASDALALFNYPGYRNPAFDAAAARVATTLDPTARRAAIADELGILAADPPVIPLYFPIGSFAYRPSVYDGWVYVKGSGILDKRSFEVKVKPPPGVGGAGSGGRPPRSEPFSLPALPLALGAGGFIAIALIGGIVELLRRRR